MGNVAHTKELAVVFVMWIGDFRSYGLINGMVLRSFFVVVVVAALMVFWLVVSSFQSSRDPIIFIDNMIKN